jgi:hypothetical protein
MPEDRDDGDGDGTPERPAGHDIRQSADPEDEPAYVDHHGEQQPSPDEHSLDGSSRGGRESEGGRRRDQEPRRISRVTRRERRECDHRGVPRGRWAITSEERLGGGGREARQRK